MKTKKIILAIIFVSIAIFVNAQIKVYSGGSVMVGATTSPATKLQVVGNSTFTSTTSSITSAAYIRGLNNYSTATTPDFTWYGNDQTGLFHPSADNIGFTTGGTERMRIDGNGCIKLLPSINWSGGIKIASYNFSGYDMAAIYPNTDWYGSLGTSSYKYAAGYIDHIWYGQMTQTSDINVKENIINITNITDKIIKLRPVNFDYKASYYDSVKGDFKTKLLADRKNKVGFIAQEVRELFPELVCKDGNNGLLGVNYIDFIPYIVQAFKEQQTQIETLQNDLLNCCSVGKTNPSDRNNNNIDNPSSTANAQNNIETSKSALLYQNNPNPFSQSTNIKCYVPKEAVNATIYIYDMQGTQIKKIQINEKEEANITIQGFELKAGMYMYTLIIDGKEIGTKKMILTD